MGGGGGDGGGGEVGKDCRREVRNERLEAGFVDNGAVLRVRGKRMKERKKKEMSRTFAKMAVRSTGFAPGSLLKTLYSSFAHSPSRFSW